MINRTVKLPAYVFSKFDEIKKKLKSDGIDIIDLGIGDPDLPTPEFIVDAALENIRKPMYHRYPPYSGLDEFKKEIAEYYNRKYGVELDWEREVAALIGSKEGIAHIFLALTDNGDTVIIPDPGYPVYNAAAIIAGCEVYRMPLTESNNYLPVLDNIYHKAVEKAKVLVVNYPNNPTGSVANKKFFRSLVRFGIENNIIIVNDGAYMDICRNDADSISLLQVPGARDICVEFGTLSKSYNMTGWRLGYVAGSREVIDRLMIIKTNFDSGQFGALQMAGVEALRNGDESIKLLNRIYEMRRRLMIPLLERMGLEVFDSRGAFYIWFKVPKSYTSQEFASIILEKTGVMITPGNTFGMFGEGYCRISLTVEIDRLEEAARRIGALKF